MVDLADITGLDDQADEVARLLADEVVVHRRGEEQGRDRREVAVGVAVREHDETGALVDGGTDLGADLVEPRLRVASPPLASYSPWTTAVA